MHSSKVSLSKALSNAALSGFNHPYSCEYSESACDKKTLDLCIFFFLILIYFTKCYFLMVSETTVSWAVAET